MRKADQPLSVTGQRDAEPRFTNTTALSHSMHTCPTKTGRTIAGRSNGQSCVDVQRFQQMEVQRREERSYFEAPRLNGERSVVKQRVGWTGWKLAIRPNW